MTARAGPPAPGRLRQDDCGLREACTTPPRPGPPGLHGEIPRRDKKQTTSANQGGKEQKLKKRKKFKAIISEAFINRCKNEKIPEKKKENFESKKKKEEKQYLMLF